MTQSIRIANASGNVKWVNSAGKYHRVDGPAIEYSDGSKRWFLNGKLHREDGPAVEDSGGSKSWYLNGVLHREDGPAVEWKDGHRAWWVNGEQITELTEELKINHPVLYDQMLVHEVLNR